MTTTYKVLAQSAPAATSNVDLYEVPLNTEAVISTLVVANRGNAAATYRIAIRPDNASLADLHYIAFDVAIPANDSTNLTLGLTLDASDRITVFASTANFTFSLFGAQIAL
jgi:hypothetical protein